MRQELTAADLVERLVQFEGPPQEFLRYLLAVQCRLAAAEAGVILRPTQEGSLEMVAIYPAPERRDVPPVWVAQAGEAAGGVLAEGKTVLAPVHSDTDMYGDAPERQLILIPIKHTGRAEVRGMSAFLMRTRDPAALRASQERLELSGSLLSLYEMQLMLQRRQLDMRRLRDALEVVSAVNQHDRFGAAAMALCNEFAARWSASRVSLGFLRGRGIRLSAISHTENFSRKMQLVQDIEATMEECLDQDVEILQPAPVEATYVSRAAARLSDQQGPSTVCSMPLRHGGEVQAVLTVERPREQPFDVESVESMRLTTDLVTARMVNLHEHDRWFGAKAARSVRKGAAAMVGPKHTWAKLLVLGVVGLIVFLIFAKGEYSVRAPFVLQSITRQRVPAAFDGILESVQADLGEQVRKGQVLATLETAELEADQDRLEAQLRGLESKYASLLAQFTDSAEAAVVQAQADEVRAQIAMRKLQIEKASLLAPLDGYVILGDLKQQIGLAVKRGDVLFEVAPVQDLRAELEVDEKDVHELREAQDGELATAGDPATRVPFVVESISPAAEMVSDRNVFKVRVRIVRGSGRMYPGLTGVAHVEVEPRRYAWIWSHRVVNWLRLKLWL